MGTEFWGRSILVGTIAGALVGMIVGGTLGRIYMRVLALAQDEALGFETSAGAIVGDLTTGGTIAIYIVALFVGSILGGAYAVGRALLPSNVPIRCAIFVLATTGFLVGTQVFLNREDFAFLPVGLSLALISATAALTALPVPLLLERFVPDPSRHPNTAARLTTATALAGFLAFGLAGVIAAYQVPTLL